MNRNAKIVKKHYAWREAEKAKLKAEKESAKENKEVQEIRKKYLPQSESKLDELKRLDEAVQNSGMLEALCAGVGGLLVFGLRMCLAMQVIGSGLTALVIGIVIGIVGLVGCGVNYPIYKKILDSRKALYRDEIFALSDKIAK